MGQIIRPDQLPIWVPGDVLRSSDGLGWKGVGLRGYRYEGLDVAVPAMTDFMIVCYLRGNTRMERRFEGRWTRTECNPGDVSLLTRSQSSHWHWTLPIDVVHVYLSDELMSRVSTDVLGRPIADVRLHDILRTHDPVVSSIADALTTEACASAVSGSLYTEALGIQLAVHLLRRYASVEFVDQSGYGQLPPMMRRRLIDYIEARLEQRLTLDELADIAGIGVWTFGKRFRVTFGTTPHQYILDLRLARAMQLLTYGHLPVKAVASACGFADQAHLTRVMRARTGHTPAALRKDKTTDSSEPVASSPTSLDS